MGQFGFTYAVMQSDSGQPEVVFDSQILMTELHIRDAWEVGKNDFDTAGIDPNDDPIIPPGEPDAPVLELLGRERDPSDT